MLEARFERTNRLLSAPIWFSVFRVPLSNVGFLLSAFPLSFLVSHVFGIGKGDSSFLNSCADAEDGGFFT